MAKSSKKKPKYNQNSAIRSALRRTFSRSPIVREVLMSGRREVPKYCKDGTRAKKDSVQYKCNVCNKWVGSTKCEVDHIKPVIDNEIGFQTWEIFIARLFCNILNLQIICSDCHDKKTTAEREIAKVRRKREKDQEAQFNDSSNDPSLQATLALGRRHRRSSQLLRR